jgi:SPX domain protein involved in polyphosphate accumulation
VSERQVEHLRDCISPFVRPDEFAPQRGLPRYPVCSLYLDSDDLQLYSQTAAGEKQRFKLRVRTYDDDPTSAAFLEVKQRDGDLVHKRRAAVERKTALALLDGASPDWAALERLGCLDDVQYFRHDVERSGARPVVRIRYAREAYESTFNEPVRITIDTEVAHCPTFTPELGHERGRFRATPLPGAVLEIKFTDRFPRWVRELVHAFGLERRSVAKYVLSVDHLLHEGRDVSFALGWRVLPPQGP